MNAILQAVPRLDAGGVVDAGVINESMMGSASLNRGLVSFSKLGPELARTDSAIARLSPYFAQRWQHDPNFRPKVAQDAAADFVTSGLRKFLGNGEDIRRGEDQPWLFVPRPGRPSVLPSRQTLEPGWRSGAYRVREQVGQAQFLDPNDVRSLQRADYNVEEKEYKAVYYGIAWGYTIPETWESDLLGEDLLGERQAAAAEAMDRFRENVSAWGNSAREIPGMFTLGDALLATGGQQFASGGPDAQQMLERISYFDQLYKRANGGMSPTAAVIPEDDRIAMQITYFGTGGEGPSVWERATDMHPWLNNAVFTENLNLGNADANASRWVLYSQNERQLFVEHTDTMVFGPFQNFMELVFINIRRIGGVVNKKPERVMYVDFTP